MICIRMSMNRAYQTLSTCEKVVTQKHTSHTQTSDCDLVKVNCFTAIRCQPGLRNFFRVNCISVNEGLIKFLLKLI